MQKRCFGREYWYRIIDNSFKQGVDQYIENGKFRRALLKYHMGSLQFLVMIKCRQINVGTSVIFSCPKIGSMRLIGPFNKLDDLKL